MMLRTSAMVLAVTTAAAAAAAGSWVLASADRNADAEGAPAASRSSAQPAAIASGGAVLCVGSDRVLRASAPGGACPAGQQPLPLRPDDDGTCELCDPFKEPPPDSGGDTELDALERRIAALEKAPYFEVVNEAGDSVFSIGPGGVYFYNKQGVPMAVLGTSDAGGHFTTHSGSIATKVTFGVSGATAGLRVMEDGLVRTDLTTRDGRSSLRMPGGTGLIAGLGESVNKTGAMLLGTRAGAMRVAFTVPESRGMVVVNGAAKGGASLSEAAIGGGLLDLADAQGDSIVRMGHVQNRYGIVMTGPVMGLPLVPKSGLPGSYFLGCGSAAPPACVPSVQ